MQHPFLLALCVLIVVGLGVGFFLGNAQQPIEQGLSVSLNNHQLTTGELVEGALRRQVIEETRVNLVVRERESGRVVDRLALEWDDGLVLPFSMKAPSSGSFIVQVEIRGAKATASFLVSAKPVVLVNQSLINQSEPSQVQVDEPEESLTVVTIGTPSVTSQCDDIDQPERDACLQNTGDVRSCERIENVDLRDACFVQEVVATGDTALCTYVWSVSLREECLLV